MKTLTEKRNKEFGALKFLKSKDAPINTQQIINDKATAKIMQGKNKVKAEEAFYKLYTRYKSSIFFMALKFLKMNKETADDMVQEIFVKAWEKKDLYDCANAFSTWLYNIAKNHLIDYKRKTNIEVLSIETLKSNFGGDEDVAEIAFQLEDKSADVFNEVVKSERAQAALDAVTHGIKSEEARQVVTLIFLADLPYEKVAEQMKMPIGTVKALMFRAKTEMKNFLSKKHRDFNYGN